MRSCARAAGGRRLAFETAGDPNGSPVFLLHGTPGSRHGPRPRSHEVALMGIRLVTYDRPGYGLSDRQPGRQVVDAADDIVALADALGFERFAVVGRSGGGPHALACAARWPDRVTSAAALVSLAPREADDLDWFAGMGEANVAEYSTAWRASDVPAEARRLARRLARLTDQLHADFVNNVVGDHHVPDGDRLILADPGIRRLLVENFRQAVADERNLAVVADGPAARPVRRRVLLGWLDDTLAFGRPWGFRPEEIDVPVLLWHGEDDVIVPADHSRWLADHIPDATLITEPGSGHFGALVVLPSVLRWLRQFLPRERSTA